MCDQKKPDLAYCRYCLDANMPAAVCRPNSTSGMFNHIRTSHFQIYADDMMRKLKEKNKAGFSLPQESVDLFLSCLLCHTGMTRSRSDIKLGYLRHTIRCKNGRKSRFSEISEISDKSPFYSPFYSPFFFSISFFQIHPIKYTTMTI